jgi:hypothetical protein
MVTTPLWVPLGIAGLGIVGTFVGTISGVLITQQRADRREDINRTHERERQLEQWHREDDAKTFEHRRAAYSDFYESLQQMSLRAYDYGMGISDDGDLPFSWNLHTFGQLQHLHMYATPRVAEVATAAYNAVWMWGNEASCGQDDDEFYRRQSDYQKLEIELLILIREALSIPDA